MSARTDQRPPLLLTIEETAAELHCHRAQVFKLIAQGRLQVAPKIGKRTMVLRSSLLALIGSAPPAVPRGRATRARASRLDGLDELQRGILRVRQVQGEHDHGRDL